MKGAYPGYNGVITFAATMDILEDRDIFIMNADGTGIQQVTFSEGDNFNPCWSPDSEKIAFTKDMGEPDYIELIYIINKNGTGETQVTSSAQRQMRHLSPAWSLNGSKIAYLRDTSGGERDIYVIEIGAGGEGTKLIDDASGPAWSPDGSKIAYQNHTDYYIWVADSDTGTPLYRVTEGGSPCWSPDGQRMVLSRGEIYTVNLDGSNLQQISNPPGSPDDYAPNWSPDGERILFDRDEETIWILDQDGSNDQALTNGIIYAAEPDWARGPKPPEAPEPVGGELFPISTLLNIAPYIIAIVLLTLSPPILAKKYGN
jgi:Tol biopolymer transport system component